MLLTTWPRAKARRIAALLQRTLFAPVLEQWHPGQPHLVEFVMKRPDSDNAAGSVANIAALAASGYRTPDEQVAELTGLQVSTDTQSMQQPGIVMPTALNSLRVRYAPTMLYPPARAAFERAINMAAQPSGSAEELRRDAAEEQPLTGGELAALRALGGELDATQLAADAGYAAEELWQGVEELAENRNYTRDNAGRFAETGAATHSHKGGRGARGIRRIPPRRAIPR